jgi:hypothetical protein
LYVSESVIVDFAFIRCGKVLYMATNVAPAWSQAEPLESWCRRLFRSRILERCKFLCAKTTQVLTLERDRSLGAAHVCIVSGTQRRRRGELSPGTGKMVLCILAFLTCWYLAWLLAAWFASESPRKTDLRKEG